MRSRLSNFEHRLISLSFIILLLTFWPYADYTVRSIHNLVILIFDVSFAKDFALRCRLSLLEVSLTCLDLNLPTKILILLTLIVPVHCKQMFRNKVRLGAPCALWISRKYFNLRRFLKLVDIGHVIVSLMILTLTLTIEALSSQSCWFSSPNQIRNGLIQGLTVVLKCASKVLINGNPWPCTLSIRPTTNILNSEARRFLVKSCQFFIHSHARWSWCRGMLATLRPWTRFNCLFVAVIVACTLNVNSLIAQVGSQSCRFVLAWSCSRRKLTSGLNSFASSVIFFEHSVNIFSLASHNDRLI